MEKYVSPRPFLAPKWSDERDVGRKTIDKIALIDADRYKHLVVYRMFDKMMEEGIPNSKEALDEIISDYLDRDIFNAFEAKDYVFCFSAPSSKTFRNFIVQEKEYKGNRKNVTDKYFYEGKFEDMAYVFEYVSKRYHTLYFDDLEADDVLSMLQCEETFIFSHDKDLKQVVGSHWNIDRREMFETDTHRGFYMLMKQLLLGDSTDNIPGLKGFGPKAFDKIGDLQGYELLYTTMKSFVDKYGLLHGMDTFVEMWTLVSLKINRGDWLREKYSKGFELISTLIKK